PEELDPVPWLWREPCLRRASGPPCLPDSTVRSHILQRSPTPRRGLLTASSASAWSTLLFLRGSTTLDVDSVFPVSSSERVEALTIAHHSVTSAKSDAGRLAKFFGGAFVSEDDVALRWGDRSRMTAFSKRESCEGACCPLHRLLTAADRSDTSNGFRRVHG